MSSHVDPTGQILNGWKEIAGYLNRGVRTVQRWETELQMPIHRPRGARGPVLATSTDLDLWFRSFGHGNHSKGALAAEALAVGKVKTSDVIQTWREMVMRIQQSRQELAATRVTLMNTITKMHAQHSPPKYLF